MLRDHAVQPEESGVTIEQKEATRLLYHTDLLKTVPRARGGRVANFSGIAPTFRRGGGEKSKRKGGKRWSAVTPGYWIEISGEIGPTDRDDVGRTN